MLSQEPVWPESEPDTGSARGPRFRRAAIIAGVVVGLLAVLYGIDLALGQGDVPRGVIVAGGEVGGMSREAAERRLRQEIEPRLTRPVRARADDVEDAVDPGKVALGVDWAATLDRIDDQPLNPITRLTSFFTTSEIGVATRVDASALAAAMERLRVQVDRAPVEGRIHFSGTTPVAVRPRAGRALDTSTAARAVVDEWAFGRPIVLPVSVTPVKASSEAVQAALDQVATPAVSGPIVVLGEGRNATLAPKTIAAALTLEPGENGVLVPKIDQATIVAAAGPQLASTETAGADAQISFDTNTPTVRPSQDGRGIDWDASLAALTDVLTRTQDREITAHYASKPAKVTTDEAGRLGIKEVIGEFTTSGFAADSGVNIRTVAQKVNGAIVQPGETFSLNDFTGPRGKAQGYVEAGVIENGAPAREVGGGISQFATTLFNASYFAAMKDAGHKEHSYYISRYPAAREATVFQNPDGSSVIDVKFTSDAPTGIAIQTIWTPSSITVKLWGTKRYTVESIPGSRSSYTAPPTKPGPAQNCKSSNGSQGFTTSDTRVIRDAATGQEISRETRTVHYNPQPHNPQPRIVCGAPGDG